MKKSASLLFALALVPCLLFSQTYTTTTVITPLAYPVAFTFAPDGSIFLTLKGGVIRKYDANFGLLGTFYNLSDSTFNDFERGLLGIEVDPNYATNGYVYVYYNHRCCNPSPTGAQFIRVVRFTDVSNVGTNPTIILSVPVSNSIPGNHVGGNVRFRPSEPNQIYVSIGDIATPANSQLLTNPFGKILRINKDGTIPTTNPFYDDGNPATGNDDRIWSYGLRNPFDFCFSTFNDSLYITENGAVTYDEVNYGMRGKNYGWQVCEGNFLYQSASAFNNPSYINPIAVWGAPLPAVTGIVHYTHSLMSAFTNHLLVADNDYGRVYDLTLGNSPYFDVVTNLVMWMDLTTTGGLTTLKQGPEGCLYAMKGGYTTTGNIMRVCPTGMDVPTPATSNLSQAVLFPNPSNGASLLKFWMEKVGEVSISVTDLAGREVGGIPTGHFSNGMHEVQLPGNLPPGNYLVRINSADGFITLKWTLIP